MYIVNTIISTQAADRGFPEMECPFCHTRGHVKMQIFNTKTVNLFWGVSMPTKAAAELHCGACRKEIPKKQWTPQQKETADTLGRQYRNKFRLWPRWFLTGIVALFLLVLGGGLIHQKFFYVNKFEEAAKAAKIAVEAPRPGMVLAFQFRKMMENSAGLDSGSFALVEKVDGKNLMVRLSRMQDDDPFFFTVPNRTFNRSDFADELLPASIDQYGNLDLVNPQTGKKESCKIQNAYPDSVR